MIQYSGALASIGDILWTTENVPVSDVSSFQGWFCTLLYLAGTLDSILIKEVSYHDGIT